ncbi:hypothetical protein BDV59DRAFT_30511 [Aspergillus ambiguus]|uniref:uncharacterized protein n=1 Tax=Aspergillus ambiguus TaxID=176160 RepID=UPI003CCD54EC
MGYPKLYVVYYRPRYGNFQHWALYVESDKENLIFEVTGQHPYFKRNVVRARPESSRSYVGKTFVAVLGEDSVQDVKSAAKSVVVDNETVEWDCQDYVLEVLDKLENEFVLDGDDEDYCEARKDLKMKRGAII